MKQQAVFVPYEVHDGQYNMDKDSQLLDYCICNRLRTPVLRFYGWKPACVSLGRNQDDSHVNKDFCIKHNIDIVRRLTGGRALLHDNELTYSFICPQHFLKNGNSVTQSYKEISTALALGLKSLGVEAEFPQNTRAKTKFEYCMSLSTGADLTCNGKKLIGSAQFRKQDYILQHGSVMFDYDAIVIESIFAEKPQKDKIAVLKDILPSVTVEELCVAFKYGFEEYFALKFD